MLTKAGIDGISAQALGTSAQPAAFNYIGLTADTATPVNTDTTLASEITTAGGGLLRAQAAYAHTNGAATSTLSKTFTGNGSDSYPVSPAKIGVFNAVTVGTMAFETKFATAATLNASGDSVAVVDTFTFS